MSDTRRWYDNDPILSEAMELLRLQPGDKQSSAADFIINLQNEVAADVIESVYQMVLKYKESGKRWYDQDPVMLKAIELLRVAPPKTQRLAALKLLIAIEKNDLDFIEDEE